MDTKTGEVLPATAVAPVADAPVAAGAIATTTAAPLPAVVVDDEFADLVADAGKGTEKIGANDVRPPRLMLCQSGSPQRKPDNAKKIDGLDELDLFNTLTKAIYGRTLQFIVIASLGSHWTEFDAELKVVELNVPEGDPRTLWRKDSNGERLKPIAVHFYDYLLFLPKTMDIVVFSFKSTQIKHAFTLNGLMRAPVMLGGKIYSDPPAWTRTYQLDTVMEHKDSFDFGGFNLKEVGITPKEVRKAISDLAKTYKDVQITIDYTDDAAELAEEPAAQGQGDPADM